MSSVLVCHRHLRSDGGDPSSERPLLLVQQRLHSSYGLLGRVQVLPDGDVLLFGDGDIFGVGCRAFVFDFFAFMRLI